MELEFRVVRRDGSVRWVLSKGRAVEKRLGSPLRMLGLKADVTDRKKADELIVGENRVLEMVALGAPLDQVLAALGSLVESQIGGQRCAVLSLAEARDWQADDGLRNVLSPITSGALGSFYECASTPDLEDPRLRRLRDDIARHALAVVWSAPIASREGTTLGLCLVFSREPWTPSMKERRLLDSVTAIASVAMERSQSDEALQLSHERYRLATTGGSVGVWDWDVKTNHVYVDPYVNGLLGYEDNEIDDDLKAWISHIHPDDLDNVLAVVRSQIAAGQPYYRVEHRMMRRDGGVRWFASRGSAIKDRDGRVVRVVGTSTDVTEQLRIRAQVEEQQYELAHLGRAALLGEMSGALAHELSQPLSAVLANAAAAQRTLAKLPHNPAIELVQKSFETSWRIIPERRR